MSEAFSNQALGNEHLFVGERTNMPFKFVVRDTLGDKLTVINAARASFQTRHEEFHEEKDTRLLRYLASHVPPHTMPFRHVFMTVEFELPEMVMRQVFRHIVGIEYTSDHSFKDVPWSEMSGRYKSYDSVYVPSKYPIQHKNKKQGASEIISPQSDDFYYRATELMDKVRALYNEMIEANVARETARVILPMGTYTHVTATLSLLAIVHLVKLRKHPDAQPEIQDFADVMHFYAEKHFEDAYTMLYEFTS